MAWVTEDGSFAENSDSVSESYHKILERDKSEVLMYAESKSAYDRLYPDVYKRA